MNYTANVHLPGGGIEVVEAFSYDELCAALAPLLDGEPGDYNIELSITED